MWNLFNYNINYYPISNMHGFFHSVHFIELVLLNFAIDANESVSADLRSVWSNVRIMP